MEKKIDIFVSGLGSGGTLQGMGKYLKEKNPDLILAAVEPKDVSALRGHKPGIHSIQGIGDGFVPAVLDRSLIDDIIEVPDEDAVAVTKELAMGPGFLCGISSGANVWAAMRLAEKYGRDKVIGTVLPDRMERYFSTGLLDSPVITRNEVQNVMKRITIAAALVCMALIAGLGRRTTAQAGSFSTRGVWVSCFEYADLGLNDKSESVFRKNANLLFSRIKANGCNTVYFHVRSYDDAIYPSSVVGWSTRISKKGKALPYDPLKILIDSAHRYGLSFHAWMNPYRVTQKKVLNPASDKTNERIVAQVKEIVNKYKVDGIHFDDYFYPTNEKKYKKVKKRHA